MVGIPLFLKNGMSVYLICVDLTLNQIEVYIGDEPQRDPIIIKGICHV